MMTDNHDDVDDGVFDVVVQSSALRLYADQMIFFIFHLRTPSQVHVHEGAEPCNGLRITLCTGTFTRRVLVLPPWSTSRERGSVMLPSL